MDPKISADIWDDPDFMELQDSEKLAVFWIVTKVNLIGYVEATSRKFARDLEAPFESLEGACKGLPRGFVRTERGIWCRNYIRRQFGHGQSLARSHMAKSIRKHLADVPEDVRRLVQEEYPEIFSSSPESPKGLGSSLEATREREREREGEIEEGGLGETLQLDTLPDSPRPAEHPSLDRLRSLFRMKPATPLDATTLRAWQKNKKAAAAISEDDWRFLEWAYRQREGDAATFRRRDLATLLNNLTTEILRARAWAAAARAAIAHPPAAEPPGWQDIITSEDPSYNCTTWWDLPESLKSFVREKLAAAAA
jgi:hypothetical protein